VGHALLGLLSEGLGLGPTRLEEASCLEGKDCAGGLQVKQSSKPMTTRRATGWM